MKSKDQQLLEEAYQTVLLSELFDTSPEKANVKWNLSDKRFIEATFNGPNDRTYYMSLADYGYADLEGDAYTVRAFGEKQWDFLKKGTYFVEFGDTTGDTNNPDYNILGTGGTSSSKVFGIVINAVARLVKNNPRVIRNLMFSAKEPSRIKMYKRLLPLLATKFDKIPFTNAKGNTFYLVDKSIPR
jgi:hypothetical protein